MVNFTTAYIVLACSVLKAISLKHISVTKLVAKYKLGTLIESLNNRKEY